MDVGSAFLGSATSVLECGCARLVDMESVGFETMALHLCGDHLRVREIREAKVKDVWEAILAHNVATSGGVDGLQDI